MSSDRRTGKPIAVKLLKIKPEVLPEERISGQVGPELHAYPVTVLHGYIHPVKEHRFMFGSVLFVGLSVLHTKSKSEILACCTLLNLKPLFLHVQKTHQFVVIKIHTVSASACSLL